MKHSLAATGLLLTVLAVGLTAQRADQYRQKYGAPDSHSRYIVRPDISMTVEFAENGQASNIVIRRLESGDPTNHNGSDLMSPAAVKEILEEVVPDARRGKLQQSGRFVSSCFSSGIDEYEHVSINQARRCMAQGDGIYYIAVHFK